MRSSGSKRNFLGSLEAKAWNLNRGEQVLLLEPAIGGPIQSTTIVGFPTMPICDGLGSQS